MNNFNKAYSVDWKSTHFILFFSLPKLNHGLSHNGTTRTCYHKLEITCNIVQKEDMSKNSTWGKNCLWHDLCRQPPPVNNY